MGESFLAAIATRLGTLTGKAMLFNLLDQLDRILLHTAMIVGGCLSW